MPAGEQGQITDEQRTKAALPVMERMAKVHGADILQDPQVQNYIQVAFGGSTAGKEEVRRIIERALGEPVDESRLEEARKTREMQPLEPERSLPERRAINTFFSLLAVEKRKAISLGKNVDMQGIVEKLKEAGLHRDLPQDIKDEIDKGEKWIRSEREDLRFSSPKQPSSKM